MSSEIDSDSISTGRGGGSRRQSSPKRRSQRQIDRQEMEQLRKIRAENEELLKKEKEEMNMIQQASPAVREPEDFPEDPLAIPEPADAEDVAPPPAPVQQPMSRLAVIHQELQQKILSVDPVKAKVQHAPAKTPALKSPTQAAPAKASPHSILPDSKSPVVVAQASAKMMTPQSPQKLGRQSPVSRLSSSGGVARPRRANRQPPKHLRDAFNQLEFEGIERQVKKTSSTKGINSPEPTSVRSVDSSNEDEKANSDSNPPVLTPIKRDSSKAGWHLQSNSVSNFN